MKTALRIVNNRASQIVAFGGAGIVAVSGFAMTTLHWYRAEVKARHRERGKYERLLEGRLDA